MPAELSALASYTRRTFIVLAVNIGTLHAFVSLRPVALIRAHKVRLIVPTANFSAHFVPNLRLVLHISFVVRCQDSTAPNREHNSLISVG